MSSGGRDQFIAFAGLRGVAALIVLQWHGRDFLGGEFLPSGYLAVDFFFLLSGWVLASAYDRRLDTEMSGTEFIRIRLIRLYPVYLLSVLMVLGAWALGHHSIAPGPLLALLFLPDVLGQTLDWVVRPSWSLTGEWIANIPFAFLHRRLTTGLLVGVIGLAFAILVLLAAQWGSVDVGHGTSNWQGLFARALFSFPLGVLLYRNREKFAKWAPKWATWPAYALLVLVFAIPAGPYTKWLLDLSIVGLALPAILIFASRSTPRPPTTAVALAFGAVSYPLYLIHWPLMKGIDVSMQAYGSSMAHIPAAAGLALVAVLVALSWLIDRYYDQPLRNWLSGRSRHKAVPTASVGSPTTAG